MATICEASLLTRARGIKSLVVRPFLDVYRFYGEFGGKPLMMVVAGDTSNVGYIRKLAFPSGCDAKKTGIISQFEAPKLACSDVDVAIVGASRLLTPKFREIGFDIAPMSVQVHLRVYDEPEAMVNNLTGAAGKTLRKDIRRMKEKGYEIETTNDDDWFDLFYHRMYRPYAEHRYGELANLCSYSVLKYDFRRGVGVRIKQNGRDVAGAVSYPRGSTMVNPWKGIIDGDEAISREGASLAVYYSLIRNAYLYGCDIADFGYSAPFVSDGALYYKLKWGMTVANVDCSRRIYAIMAPRRSEEAMEFLRANRYYRFGENGLELSDEF